MSKRILYAGSFPPPYGGVTIKNALIVSILSNHFRVMNCKKKNGFLFMLSVFLKSFFCSSFVFGVGSNQKLIKILKIFNFLHPFKIKKSVVVVMGGTFAASIEHEKATLRLLKKIRGVLVETEQMRQKLNQMSLDNVYLFPNCRKKPTYNLNKRINNPIRCIYYSKISKEKGADIVLKIASDYPNLSFDFWGPIDDSYEYEFLSYISEKTNCHYNGIYLNKDGQLYSFLNNYDLLIFPSTWKHEGVSGALVEAKIAGVPAIVSNWNYNSSVVIDGVDGLVVKSNDEKGFKEAMDSIINNALLLAKMKENAISNGRNYYIETYEKLFLKLLEEQNERN